LSGPPARHRLRMETSESRSHHPIMREAAE
jgi:hypothetical protein